MKEKLKDSRLVWADLVRVVAIVLVVAVHTISPESSQASFWFFILAKTCIPLFLMLSGALLLPKKESLEVFFKKRLKRIVWPWAFWAIVFVVILHRELLFSPWLFLLKIKEVAISEFTFIPLIFSIYLLMPALRVLVQNAKGWLNWYAVGLWFLGVSALPYLVDSLAWPLHVDNGLVRQTVNFMGFVILGHLLNVSKSQLTKKWWPGLILVVVGWLGAGWLVIRTGQNEWLAYVSPLVILESAGMFMVLKKVGQVLKNKLVGKILAQLSLASFSVFLAHSLFLKLIFVEPNTLRFITILVISYGAVLIIKNISYNFWKRWYNGI